MRLVILGQQSNTLMIAGAIPRILALGMLCGEWVKGGGGEGGVKDFMKQGDTAVWAHPTELK